MNPSHTTLRECVLDYIDETQQTMGQYLRLWNIAYNGLVQIGLDVSWEPRTVRIPVASNRVVNFPRDCMKWLRVGINGDNGELITMATNSNLSSFKGLSPNRIEGIASDVGALDVAGSPIFYNYYNNGTFIHLPSTLASVSTGVTVNSEDGTVILDPQAPWSHLMFSYISVPRQNDDFTIPLECKVALLEWIYFRDNKGRRKRETGQYKRDWLNEKHLSKRRMRPFSLSDAVASGDSIKII